MDIGEKKGHTEKREKGNGVQRVCGKTRERSITPYLDTTTSISKKKKELITNRKKKKKKKGGEGKREIRWSDSPRTGGIIEVVSWKR